MHVAARPYLAASVALLGASTIAVSPLVPTTPQVHLPVQLTAAVDNPITVFAPVATAVQDLYSSIQDTLTTPDPTLTQLTANVVAGAQVFAANPVGVGTQVINNVLAGLNQLGPNLTNLAETNAASSAALTSALNDMGAGLPAALQAAGEALNAGDPNGAINALVLAGVQPVINIFLFALTPEINAIGQVAGIPQPILDATANAALGVVLSVASSTIGIGWHVDGPQPLVQQFITGIQTVAAGAASGDQGTFINAVQHSIADFTADVFNQATATLSMANYINSSFADALKQITPKAVAATTAASTTALTTAAAAKAVTAAATSATVAEAATATTTEKSTTTPETNAANASDAAGTGAADSSAASSTSTKESAKESAKVSAKTATTTQKPATTETATTATSSDATSSDSSTSAKTTTSKANPAKQAASRVRDAVKKATSGTTKKDKSSSSSGSAK
ncbi:hypothetical protein [Mycobacterium sp. OTB74]|uniref:hypothetical protein n=1 Tax=Mycobacterium sp. OTB74 TaxID=1853452 RepID=UPI002474E7D8|nr:hypothetical protein [Mycobacterium sp. OTB74]MDH6242463.1 hypothetical protein [Mycobacterium sp. OTB74]